MNEEEKKTKILMIISILTLLVLVTGATFAYFTAQGETGAQTNINVTTHTTDMLTFATSAPITITADQETFASGKGNREGTTTASATLRANSKTNSATEHYNLYLDITNNTFEYTTDTKTAELILTIKNPEGNVVTSINGLNYVTVNEVSGFDVTEYNNLITIANNKEITSTGTKIEEWEVTLTLINLDSNQNANTGKTFNASLMIQKEMILAQYIKNLYTTQGANNLYLHNGTITDAEGNIMDAEDGSYRYSGGDYKVAEVHKSEYASISDIIKYEYPEESANYYEYYLAYDASKVHYSNPAKVVEKALEDGYVEKNSVNNYVCFGSNKDECPYDNLYRIIGIFDGKAKLIKADFATEELLGTDGNFNSTLSAEDSYGWLEVGYVKSKNESNSYYTNTWWPESELNKTNLNKNYIDYLGNEWTSKISSSFWSVNGMTYNQATRSNAKTAYDYEIGDSRVIDSGFEPITAKIGLMYASDYYYAALPNYWSLPGLADDIPCLGEVCAIQEGEMYVRSINENWLYMFDMENLLSRVREFECPNCKPVLLTGYGFVEWVDNATPGVVRPTFYLNSTVEYVSGSGTETDPYRIK